MVASAFGDPGCWLADLSFLACCSVAAFGPGGNAACWGPELNTSFQRCCLDFPFDEAKAGKTLRAAEVDFREAVSGLAEVVHRLDLERHALGSRPLRAGEAQHLSELSDLVRQWREAHLRQLAAALPSVFAAYEAALPRRPKGAAPRVAVLLACTPESAGSEVCRLGAALWQCYAARHGYHFVFDQQRYPAHPRKFRFRDLVPKGLAEALDADFTEEHSSFLQQEPLALEVGSDALDFKWWQRWYAARRHLAAYDLLLVVDPDTAVFPSCAGVGLPEALGLDPEDPESWPGVLARRPRLGEDLNGGVFALGGGPWGHLFLDLLLAKSRWPLDVAGGGGWCHARQSAEHETLLEVMALADVLLSERPLAYGAECLRHALPQVFYQGSTAHAGCIWPEYTACWRRATAGLALGPASPVRLREPAEADVNYRPWSNEPRYRRRHRGDDPLPPVANAAFLWHYVGVPDKVGSLLRDFGLSGIEDALDCGRLAELTERLPTCGLAGSREPCPYEDSDLMPLGFGC